MEMFQLELFEYEYFFFLLKLSQAAMLEFSFIHLETLQSLFSDEDDDPTVR